MDNQHYNLNTATAVKISRRDFFALPANMRHIDKSGPRVLATRAGRQVFLPAQIVS